MAHKSFIEYRDHSFALQTTLERFKINGPVLGTFVINVVPVELNAAKKLKAYALITEFEQFDSMQKVIVGYLDVLKELKVPLVRTACCRDKGEHAVELLEKWLSSGLVGLCCEASALVDQVMLVARDIRDPSYTLYDQIHPITTVANAALIKKLQDPKRTWRIWRDIQTRTIGQLLEQSRRHIKGVRMHLLRAAELLLTTAGERKKI